MSTSFLASSTHGGYAGLEMVRIQDLVPNYPNFENLCTDIIDTLKNSGYFKDVIVKQL